MSGPLQFSGLVGHRVTVTLRRAHGPTDGAADEDISGTVEAIEMAGAELFLSLHRKRADRRELIRISATTNIVVQD